MINFISDIQAKAQVLHHGFSMTNAALNAFSSDYLFKRRVYSNYDDGYFLEIDVPPEIVFPNSGIVATAILKNESPWTVDYREGCFFLRNTNSDAQEITVDFIKKPEFYGKKLKNGEMRGYSTDYRYAVQSSVTDTLRYNQDTLNTAGLRFGDEIGIGISIKGGEKWSAEFNYLRSDWRKSGMDNAPGFSTVGGSVFSSSVSQSFRAGFEIVPNRNDIRYYLKRCAYRAGVYYDQSYYRLDGRDVNTIGLTLGVTLPVFRWYNGISLGVDLGQRASKKNDMIRERYAMFVVGFNIHDIWFQKPRYN